VTPDTVQIGLLGPIDVKVAGVPCSISGLRRKSVLAILALHPGKAISLGRLIELVWAGDPPMAAVNSLQQHISYLRGRLRASSAILAHPAGYLLDVPAAATDVGRAIELIGQSKQTADRRRRAGQLRAALRLWRGPSLVEVAGLPWLNDQARRLDDMRLYATERLAEARLESGEHVELVPELEELAGKQPIREGLYELLMLALYRSGRQAEALAVYQQLRRRLHSEMSAGPRPAARALEAAILRQDPDLRLPSPDTSAAPGLPLRITPARLPCSSSSFTGRRSELAQLRSHLPTADDQPGRPRATTIVLVSGAAGAGKTALVIQFAYQVREHYPDGLLYVDLRSSDQGRPAMDPAEAVLLFLDALGVSRDRIPTTPDAQGNLYRSLLNGRRVLLVVDDARDEQQVRPLLPGTSGCLVLVTSRRQLPGLVVTEGAHPLTLETA